MDVEDAHIGRRIREVRSWRGLSLTAAAGLAGFSAPYLSMIERGQRPVTRRATLEGLARALRVSPVELTGKPYAPSDAASRESHAAMAAVEDALTSWWVGEFPDAPRRPWPEVQSDLDRLNSTLRPNSDYAAIATLLPSLIRDLLAAVADPEHRRAALLGLMHTYKSARVLTSRFGYSGLPALAVARMHPVAEELADPVWRAYVAWERAIVLNGTNRARQYELAVAAADVDGARPETRGLANLTAALASAAQGHEDVVETHLTEAAALAELIEADVSPWAYGGEFGRTNVRIWRITIGVELGQGARVAEIAPTLRQLEKISRARQADFWADYGRGLLSERKTREHGLAALLHAEKVAPQKVHNNAFAREAVSSLLATARRDAGGRELRGLAWRMGLAPTG